MNQIMTNEKWVENHHFHPFKTSCLGFQGLIFYEGKPVWKTWMFGSLYPSPLAPVSWEEIENSLRIPKRKNGIMVRTTLCLFVSYLKEGKHGGFHKCWYPPNHPFLIGFSIIFTIHFWGTPIFWKHPHISKEKKTCFQRTQFWSPKDPNRSQVGVFWTPQKTIPSKHQPLLVGGTTGCLGNLQKWRKDIFHNSKVVSTHRTGTHTLSQPLPTGYVSGIPFIVGRGSAPGVLYRCAVIFLEECFGDKKLPTKTGNLKVVNLDHQWILFASSLWWDVVERSFIKQIDRTWGDDMRS